MIKHLLIVLLMTLSTAAAVFAQTAAPTISDLNLNQPVKRAIKANETHEFALNLKKGEFVRVEAEPLDIDVVLSLVAPDGKTVAEMDGDANYVWRPTVSALAPESGRFVIRIKGSSVNPDAAGNYTIVLQSQRSEQPADKSRLAAENALNQAIRAAKANDNIQAAAHYRSALDAWRAAGDQYWEAVTLWNLAYAVSAADRNAEALELFKQSVVLFQTVKDRTGEAAALNGIGNIHRFENRPETAVEFLEKALVIRRELKRTRSEFNSLNVLAQVYAGLRQIEKTRESLTRMLAISDELKDLPAKRDALQRLGLFSYAINEYEKGVPYYEQALALDRASGDQAGESVRLKEIAVGQTQLRQFENARKNYERALEIAVAIKNRQIEADILNEFGFFYLVGETNYDKTSELLVKSIAIRQELKDQTGEMKARSPLCLAYLFLGEYEKLIENAKKGYDLSVQADNREYQTIFLEYLGTGLQNIGKSDEAVERFERALVLARATKLVSREISALMRLASLYEGAFQQYEKSLALRTEALARAREIGDKVLSGYILSAAGSTLAALKRYDEALSYYRQALENSRALNEKSKESHDLQLIGDLHARRQQFDEAENYLKQARALARTNNFKDREIYILISLGDLERDRRQFDRAAAQYEQALKLAENLKSLYWESSLYLSLGNVAARSNDYIKARNYFGKSAALARNSKNYAHEAFALTGLANIHFELSQYEQARDYYEQAARIAGLAKNRWMFGSATGGLGSIYSDLNNSEKAAAIYELSLRLFIDVFDRSGEGSILYALGSVYQNLRNYDKAQKFFEQSLAIARGQKNKTGEGRALGGLGGLFYVKNDNLRAEQFYKQALDLAEQTKDRAAEGYTLNGLGAVRFRGKNHAEAEDSYRRALEIAGEIQSKKLEANVLQNLTELYRALGRPRIAIVYGKRAVNIFEEIRRSIKSFDQETQANYLQDKTETYRLLADLLISENRFAEAQIVLDLIKTEEYKALTTRSAAGGGGAQDADEIIPYSAAEAETLAKIDRLATLVREQKELQKLKKEQPENFPAEKQRRLDELAADIKAANAEFEKTLLALAQTAASAESRALQIKNEKNLQSALAALGREQNTGVVALYTVIGTEETKDETKGEKAANEKGTPAQNEHARFGWVIMVTPTERKAYKIDVENLEKLVFEFRGALSSDRLDPRPLAERIYTAIFRQTSAQQQVTLEQDLRVVLGKYPDKTLMWSLDGVLRYIPMAALHDGDTYLVEKYRHVVFTGESLLWLMNQPSRDTQTLGLGVTAGNAQLKMSPLPGVEKELTDIVRQTGEKTGILRGARRIDARFTKQEILNLKDADNPFQVVHIASHYSFNPFDPDASYLLVGGADGKLTFGDLKAEDNLFGNVDLLTLSACDTGVSGNGRETEGFAYLAQDLGAKSVIASLWKVSDEGTPELMIKFYRQRATNSQISKGEAFRRAQLELLTGTTPETQNAAEKNAPEKTANTPTEAPQKRSDIIKLDEEIKLAPFQKDARKPFAHPHYWAPFVLIGNWK